MNEIIVSTNRKELDTVLSFIKYNLINYTISQKYSLQLELAIEEIFINIVSYSNSDNVKILCDIDDENEDKNLIVKLKFLDKGIKFNPLEKKDPNLKVSIEDKPIGGLGIFLAKKNTDKIEYEYVNNTNCLTIIKKLL